MSVRRTKDVKVIRGGGTFISKAFIRKGLYGVSGLVFEFSDGHRVSFIGSDGGPMTILEDENCGYAPVGGGVPENYIKHCDKMKKTAVIVVDMPEGFDTMLFKYNNNPDNYRYSVGQLYFYKNKVLLGGYKYDGSCCHTTKELSLPQGQIANGFFIQQSYYLTNNQAPYIFPKELYGTTELNTKPIDGSWVDGTLTVRSGHSTITQHSNTKEFSEMVSSVSVSAEPEKDWSWVWIVLFVGLLLSIGGVLVYRKPSSVPIQEQEESAETVFPPDDSSYVTYG